MNPRPYQSEAVTAILREWQTVRTTLLVLPTGCGKTIVFSLLSSQLVKAGARVLILAHRDELIRQAADKLHKATGLRCAIEKADERAGRSLFRVIVGSVQTLLSPERRDSLWKPTHIIVDEAHHVLSDSYQAVLAHWPDAKVLGVTATPDRGDMRNLGTFFETLAYEYSMPQAVNAGYLSHIKALTIPLRIDATGLKTNGGDYSKESVAGILEGLLPQIGKELAEHAKDRKTLIFAPLCATARKVQDAMNANGLTCYYCDGEDRSEIKAFEAAGPGSAMVNAMLLTEGYDCPSIDCVCVLRATAVRALYAQMVGRGTRIHPGKDHLLLIDFLWMTRRHELCRPAHLISDDDEIAQAITEQQEKKAGGVMELDAAALEAARLEVIAKREEALAKRLAEMRHKRRELVDPLQFAASVGSNRLLAYQPALATERAPITPAQVEALAKAGIFPGDVTTSGHAQAILDTLASRKDQAMSQPRQVRFLESKGYKHAGALSFAEAQRMVTKIAANSWRVPDGMKREWKQKGVLAE